MRIMALLICSVLSWCGVAQGTTYQILGPRVFASPRGERGLKVIPSKNNVGAEIGIFFAVNRDGIEKVMWKRRLLASPWSQRQVLIHERHNIVITLDNAIQSGYKHSLVIYGSKGQVVRDFALKELLTKDEIARHTTSPPRFGSLPSRNWRHNIDMFILGSERISGRDVPMLEVIFTWGKHVKINLKTGWIKTWKSKFKETLNKPPEVITMPATGA